MVVAVGAESLQRGPSAHKTITPNRLSLIGGFKRAAVDHQLMANCCKSRIRLYRGDVMLFKDEYNI